MTRVSQPQRDIGREKGRGRERERERERERGRGRERKRKRNEGWSFVVQKYILRMYFRQAKQIVSRKYFIITKHCRRFCTIFVTHRHIYT